VINDFTIASFALCLKTYCLIILTYVLDFDIIIFTTDIMFFFIFFWLSVSWIA